MHDYDYYLNDYYDDGTTPHRKKKRTKPKRNQIEMMEELLDGGDQSEGDFNPSFHASRHERAWIQTYLGPFYREHLITDVLRQVKGGKEASVYCCSANPVTGVDLLAAKVYRPRMFRNLRNDALYRQNRTIIDDGGKAIRKGAALAAVQRKSSFGLELAHSSWLAHEHETMRLLYDAGVEVPRPLARGDNAILMEYMGEELMAASTLNHVRLEEREAHALFDRLVDNIDLMLATGRVHGDLSAYNVLYWEGEIRIIDFPQAVNPYDNPDSRKIFDRDVLRVCQYFMPYGIEVDAAALAESIWSRHIQADTLMPLVLMRIEEE